MQFNQVFVALLGLSLLSAFVLPPRYTHPVRSIQKLFAPVAWPAQKVSGAVRQRVAPPRQPDTRAADDVKAENVQLRAAVLNLTGQLEEMRRVNSEREALGDVRPMCTPFRIVGTDPTGYRDSLAIAATAADGVEERMPVLYRNTVIGRIDRVGAAGAQVQLITDPKFQARARFYRHVSGGDFVLQDSSQPLVVGAGRGLMTINNMPLREMKGHAPDDRNDGIAAGDYVVLEDPDWPQQLKSQILGRVENVRQQSGAPQHAKIDVRPVINPLALREVMVMNKLGGG